jgi:hypothetical protein
MATAFRVSSSCVPGPSAVELISNRNLTPIFFAVPSVWTLQPDTAQTGFITFAYRAPFLDAIDGPDATRSEAIVEIKTKIDSAGVFKGVEYVRIEGPLTIRLRG